MLLSVAVAISVWVYLDERSGGGAFSPDRNTLIGFMSLILGATLYFSGLVVAGLFVNYPLVGKQTETSRQEVLSLEGKPNSYGWEASSLSGNKARFYYRNDESIKKGFINYDGILYTSEEKAVYITTTKGMRSWITFPLQLSEVAVNKKLVLPENGKIFKGYEPAPATE